MKNILVPFSGTGWFLTSFSSMRNRLLFFLFGRIIFFVRNYSFGPPVGLPLHFLMIGTDTTLASHSYYPPLLFQAEWIDLPGPDTYPDSVRCRWFSHEESAFAGNTLTSFPFWRNN